MTSPYGTSHSMYQMTPPTPSRSSAAANASSNVPLGEPAVEKIRRHPHYYLMGGDVHFLVENYLFRVHRYFFERESAFFREKLAIPAIAGQTAKGSSDSNPFSLEDVQAVDFSRFLWVFYNPKYSIYDAQVDDWSAILRLAFDWRFGEVKQLACRELEKFIIDPVQKIDLYQRYELDRKLLIPSYSALTFRPEPLSVKEGRQLGLETALLLAEAREYARGKLTSSGARSPSSADLDQDRMTTIISQVFGINMNAPLSPPEEVGDVFGIAPASPPVQSTSVPLRSTANSTTHSRQPSRNLSRAPSPPPLTTNLPSISQTLASAKPVNAPEHTTTTDVAGDNATGATAAAQDQDAQTKEQTTAEANTSAPGHAQAGNQTGQAVTSSPPSSILQRLMSDSTSQEDPPNRKVHLAPLEIPQIPQTNPVLEEPIPDHSRRTATQNKKENRTGIQVEVQAGTRRGKRELRVHEDDVTTTTPVVNKQHNTNHDATSISSSKRKNKREGKNGRNEKEAGNPKTGQVEEPEANDDSAVDNQDSSPKTQTAAGDGVDLRSDPTETEQASRKEENGETGEGTAQEDTNGSEVQKDQQKERETVQPSEETNGATEASARNGDTVNGTTTQNGGIEDPNAEFDGWTDVRTIR